MPPERQDFMLRLTDELRRYVEAILGTNRPGRGAEAMHAVLHAQQQLFQRPPAEFLGLAPDAQLDLLTRGEPPAGAAEKASTYVVILQEAARIYEVVGRPPLATGSRQLALQIALVAAARWPEQRKTFAPQVAELRAALPAEAPPPLRELLAAWDAAETK